MSTNLATTRLLAAMPEGITFVEVADDVYACNKVHKEAILNSMGAYPQVAFLINQNMRADKVAINNVGECGWVLRPASAPIANSMLTVSLGTKRKLSALRLSEEGGIVLSAGSRDLSVTEKLVMLAGGGPHVYARSAALNPATCGPYPVGVTKPVSFPRTSNSVSYTEAQLEGIIATGVSPDRGTMEVSPLPSRVVQYLGSGGDVTFNSVVYHDSVVQPLEKDLMVVAGPACFEYAEFFPDFTWISASYAQVAHRLDAFISHMKAKDASINTSDFEKALADMMKTPNHKLVLFKGSPSFSPLDMWPAARAAKLDTLSGVPTDGSTITEQSRADGLAAWETGRWCLTALGEGTSLQSLSTTLLPSSPTTITVKPSGLTTAHVDDSAGILDVEIGDTLVELIHLYRRGGMTVQSIPSSFLNDPTFNKEKWDECLAAMTVSPIPEQIDSSQAYASLGESICARLLATPCFSPDEELMVIPAMSPQYFWSKYAREKVNLG